MEVTITINPDLPLVSIVTVVLNGDTYLEQSILSVLNQTYSNIELIIIDGGSTDLSLDIIKRYEDRIGYWLSEPDDGIYDAMNKGIAFASGKLVGLLNADDFYEPTAVGDVVTHYLEHACPQIIYGNTHVLKEQLNLQYNVYGDLKYWRGMRFSHQAMFVHKDIYTMLGPYDTTLPVAGDYDFVIKAITSGVRFSQLDSFLVNYRDSGVSSNDQLATMAEWHKVLRRYTSITSKAYLVFLLLFMKSTILLTLLKVIKKVVGDRMSARASSWYLRKFNVSDPEYLESK